MGIFLKLPLTNAPHLASSQERPGKVAAIRGIVFQSDVGSAIGRFFVRPLEGADQWWAGLVDHDPSTPKGHARAPLAMHAGVLAVLEDGREVVAEQLAARVSDWMVNGLHWTPVEEFRVRNSEAGGWDAVVPADQFRQLSPEVLEGAVERLNSISGRPFFLEDCTGFIGRVFGERVRMFADSPVLRSLGFDFRSGEPALPLLRRDARFDSGAEEKMRAELLRELPDPQASAGGVSVRQLNERGWILGACLLLAVLTAVRRSAKVAAR